MRPPHHGHEAKGATDAAPRVIAWETTRRCALHCRHCRGSARDQEYVGELTTAEGLRLIDAIADLSKPILILTGGEPMARDDIYEFARRGTDRGLRVVMAPCGHMLNEDTTQRLIDSGVKRISISLDGPDADSHDAFRGVPGAFDAAINGLRHATAAGLEFQINTTVTRENVEQLPRILDLAVRLGAATFDIFFLVPTGRGSALADLVISPGQYEKTLRWIAQAADEAPLFVKTTCAPHYARIAAQKGRGSVQGTRPKGSAHPHGHGRRPAGGCIAGRGFVFISHVGVLQPCGFLDIPCGNLREADFDFRRLYETSRVYCALRDVDGYGGKCGACEFRRACGGCRARAYADTGDFLAEEPGCVYVPRGTRG